MEHDDPRRYGGAIAHLLADPMPSTYMDWAVPHSSSPWREVICPQPIRPTRSKRSNVQYRQTESDVLDFILNEGDREGDFESSNQVGFSPPVRSSNPMTRDVAFGNVSSSFGGGSNGGVDSSPRVERVGSPCGSSSPSFSNKPQIRIEGFSSANSDSSRVVPALA